MYVVSGYELALLGCAQYVTCKNPEGEVQAALACAHPRRGNQRDERCLLSRASN